MILLTVLVLGPLLGGAVFSAAAELTQRVKVETLHVGLHPGMNPGLYICAQNHLHVKGTVQNLSNTPVGKVTVMGRAFDAEGKLLGTATGTTKEAFIPAGGKAEVNVEFLTVTGVSIDKVKKHELVVTEAPAKR